MPIEGEVLTIHEKIAQAHKDNLDNFGMGDKQKKVKVYDAPKVSDIEEIKQVLNYILDKLHSMDQHIRGQARTYYGAAGESTPAIEKKP